MIMIDINEIPEFYQDYVKKLKDGSVVENLENTGKNLAELVRSVPQAKEEFAYAEGKWTIKEVIQHIIDAERVFSYRSLRFSRMDKTDLSGFEQNDYVPASKANERAMDSLFTEFGHVRASTIDLFSSFDQEMMKQVGTANGFPFSVQSIGYITAGHCLHHSDIIKERYLNAD